MKNIHYNTNWIMVTIIFHLAIYEIHVHFLWFISAACETLLDLAILLDISSNIDDVTFEAMKTFILDLIDSFNIGDQSVQIALVPYNANVAGTFILLDEFSDKQSLKQEVSALTRRANIDTNTGTHSLTIFLKLKGCL